MIDKYFVITNRDQTAQVIQLLNNPSKVALAEEMPKATKSKSRPQWLVDLFDDYPNEESAIDVWANVLARLEKPLLKSHHAGTKGLEDFARRHGVLPAELEIAMQRLLGKFLDETTAGRRLDVTTAWLRESLVGAPDACELRFAAVDGIVAAARNDLRERLSKVAGAARNVLTRRRLADELADQIRRYPVTFVCGNGGCGKTVLAVRHLSEMDRGPVGMSFEANDVSEVSLLDSLRRLQSQNHPAQLPRDDTLAQAIGRLDAANPDHPVLLAVDLDGLDEANPARHGELKRLIRLWIKEGGRSLKAKLVVSCRPRTDSRQPHDALIREWAGFPFPEDASGLVGFVDVGDFDLGELAEAAMLLGGEAENRLLRDSRLADALHADTVDWEIDSEVTIPPGLLESLRHPVVWEAYARLQPRDRELLLDGSSDAADLLAKRLLDRFLSKCCVRRNYQWQETDLENAFWTIGRIAANTAERPFARSAVWDAGCQNMLNETERSALYVEALTYGLIIKGDQPLSWLWRHDFVANYLARGES